MSAGTDGRSERDAVTAGDSGAELINRVGDRAAPAAHGSECRTPARCRGSRWSATQPVLVGEAKWAKRVNGSSLLGGMRRKLYDSKLADPDNMTFVVCAREVVERSEGMTVVTAADIFG